MFHFLPRHLLGPLLPHYRKFPKTWDTQKFAVITLKVEQGGHILE